MYVSMTPHGESGKVLHCSQNDGEDRKFEIQLYDEKSVIDGIVKQLYFPTYKGGTEQLLPSTLLNGQVDLGSLEWQSNFNITYGYFYTSIPSDMKIPQTNAVPNWESNLYTPKAFNEFVSNVNMTMAYENNLMRFINTSYATTNEFKQAMQGVILYYETTSNIPTTSNFRGTIEYPNGEVESEFVYRESPTNEDGRAKISEIKGNTIKFNQLVQNGNFADTSNWTAGSNNTLTVSNNIASIVINTQYTGISQPVPYQKNHKYFIRGEIKKLDTSNIYLQVNKYNVDTSAWEYLSYSVPVVNEFYKLRAVFNVGNISNFIITIQNNSVPNSNVIQAKNIQLFDLTLMGIDNLTTPSQVEEWLSTHIGKLDYYDYTLGDLISFKGTGLKITGKNLLDNSIFVNKPWNANTTNNQRSRPEQAIYIPIGTSLTVSVSNEFFSKYDYAVLQMDKDFPANQTSGDSGWRSTNTTIITATTNYIGINIKRKDSGNIDLADLKTMQIQVELGTQATDYEPYTSSTLNLPTLDYFTTGMKSAETVYDELNQSQVIQRMGMVDLGSLNWIYNSTYGMYSTGISDSVKKPSASSIKANAVSQIGTFTDWATFFASGTSSGLCAINTSGYIGISTTETNPEVFKTSLSGVYLIYELANQITTNLKSASLVCKGTELPIYNNEVSLLEEVTEEAGMFDCKVKLQNGDDVAYSEKLSLYVERKPL